MTFNSFIFYRAVKDLHTYVTRTENGLIDCAQGIDRDGQYDVCIIARFDSDGPASRPH